MATGEHRGLIFVGMSGGVDSSVSALLLKEQGYDVVGVFIKSWDGLPTKDGVKFREQCRWKEDRRDAIRVAAKLRIPFRTYDFTEAYYEQVIEYFFREHEAGRTPNPDIMCNREIKFKLFLERALVEGADMVATGHYVRIQKSKVKSQNVNPKSEIKYQLLIAKDESKDQSYFLYTLTQRELARVLFPIGEYTKKEVREMAWRAGLSTADKPDSQGLCFVGEVSMEEFLKARIKPRVGAVVTSDGRYVGEHDGVPFYTIGQRHGLRLSSRLPYYVAAKNLEHNTLVVGEGNSDPALYRAAVEVAEVSWTDEPPVFGQCLGAKIRYRQPTQNVRVLGESYGQWSLSFDEPQRAVTPGQSLVLYDGERVVGGGVIM